MEIFHEPHTELLHYIYITDITYYRPAFASASFSGAYQKRFGLSRLHREIRNHSSIADLLKGCILSPLSLKRPFILLSFERYGKMAI